jgi:hypothetical protein
MYALTVHVVYGISTAATNANHFDDAMILLGCSEVKDIYIHIVV